MQHLRDFQSRSLDHSDTSPWSNGASVTALQGLPPLSILSITRSSEANLLAEIDRLGTNLLTVVNGQSFGGQEAELPLAAPAMIGRVAGVEHMAPTAELTANVFRTDKIPSFQTAGLSVRTADTRLLATLNGRLRLGVFLDAATMRYPACA